MAPWSALFRGAQPLELSPRFGERATPAPEYPCMPVPGGRSGCENSRSLKKSTFQQPPGYSAELYPGVTSTLDTSQRGSATCSAPGPHDSELSTNSPNSRPSPTPWATRLPPSNATPPIRPPLMPNTSPQLRPHGNKLRFRSPEAVTVPLEVRQVQVSRPACLRDASSTRGNECQRAHQCTR